MSDPFKATLCSVMAAALAFGFFHHVAPDRGDAFERLHIFLFNLVSGGTSILWFAQGRGRLTPRLGAFFILAALFAVSAFFDWYGLSAALCLGLFAIVESVRIGRFSFFPARFFDPRADSSEKFLEASLLCLSIGLLLCCLAILDTSRFHIVNSPKFSLYTFFLGFSFPVSLVSFSMIFKIVPPARTKGEMLAHNAAFWLLNLGVIIFFAFILAGSAAGETAASITLYFAVLLTWRILHGAGEPGQPRAILLSGLGFLLLTALTGIAFILFELAFGAPPPGRFLLRLHAFLALYGWNLSGLVVLLRLSDFPLALSPRRAIGLHWLVVAVAAPAGYESGPAAIFAVILYAAFLRTVLFAPRRARERTSP